MNGQIERDDDAPDVAGENDDSRPAPGDAESVGDDVQATPTDEPADPLAQAQAQAEDNWNKYVRAAAELENVRKRAVRDVDNARKFALERFGGDLLAVCDSLEMGLATAESADAGQMRTGSENTLKLLKTTMERFGVTEIDPEGEPFNPEQHEAMTMQPSADVEPGTVLTVFQKGYMLNGRLLRPARVIVASELASSDEKE